MLESGALPSGVVVVPASAGWQMLYGSPCVSGWQTFPAPHSALVAQSCAVPHGEVAFSHVEESCV
jgi:hypothetical protein